MLVVLIVVVLLVVVVVLLFGVLVVVPSLVGVVLHVWASPIGVVCTLVVWSIWSVWSGPLAWTRASKCSMAAAAVAVVRSSALSWLSMVWFFVRCSLYFAIPYFHCLWSFAFRDSNPKSFVAIFRE